MKEKPRIQFLRLLLVISISFFILVISASSVSGSQFIIYSVHTPNNYYSADVTNDNSIVFHEDGQQLWSQKIDDQVKSIAISSDGKNLAIGCDGGVIYLYTTDFSPTLLWKRTFGNTLIKSISLPDTNNFIEASNTLNQAFLITKTGNLINVPKTPSVTIVPSKTPTNYLQDDNTGGTENTGGTQNSLITLILFTLIIFGILFVIIKIFEKSGSTSTYQPHPTTGSIYSESIPSGAHIYLDGVNTGVTPFTIWALNPGTYVLKSSLNGYDSDTQRITISAGQTFVYSPTLHLLKSSPHPQTSKTTPDTTKPPIQPIKFSPPGSHTALSFRELITQLGAKTSAWSKNARRTGRSSKTAYYQSDY